MALHPAADGCSAVLGWTQGPWEGGSRNQPGRLPFVLCASEVRVYQ